jgi:SOS-response transcriptional repressor LexA
MARVLIVAKRGRVALTEKRLLEYITRFVARYGAEPSYSMICKHFKLKSKTKVLRYIASLEKRGLIKKRDSGPIRLATQT